MFVVAGATGNVGSVVVKELLQAGEKVTAILRDAKKGQALAAAGATLAVGSLDDEKFLAGALAGAEGLFAMIPPDYPATGVIAWQHRIADAFVSAVKASKLPHVVLLSSVGADLSDGTGPIKGLHYFESALRSSGVKLTAVRAGYFQENVLGNVGAAKAAGIYPNMGPSADAPMPMIASRDIGAVAAHELRFPSASSDVLDLHGPSYSLRQASELLGARLGKKLNVVDVPNERHVSTLTEAGLPKEVAELYAEMFAGFASGKVKPSGDRFKLGRTRLEKTLEQVS